MAGGTIARTPHFVLHRGSLDAKSPSAGPATDGRSQALFVVRDQPWMGAVVPKRWARRAVTRNGIKRQIYNVSAAYEDRLAAAAHVVRLRMDFARKEFPSAWSEALKAQVRGELEALFGRAAEKKAVVGVDSRLRGNDDAIAVIPAPPAVIPASARVIPAQAGIHPRPGPAEGSK